MSSDRERLLSNASAALSSSDVSSNTISTQDALIMGSSNGPIVKRECKVREAGRGSKSAHGFINGARNSTKVRASPIFRVTKTRRSSKVFASHDPKTAPTTDASSAHYNPIIREFRESWGIEPSWPLVAFEGLKLSEAVLPFESNHLSPWPSYAATFIVPAAMPFMILTRPSLGSILCTPFYSVILDFCPNIPDALFSMRSLTLDRVIMNTTFRHELAFNPALKIELSAQTMDALNCVAFWKQLVLETEEIFAHPVVHGPATALPFFLEGMEKLMISVMPRNLSAQIRASFDLDRLLGRDASEGRGLIELLEFLHITINAHVHPRRRGLARKMSEYFVQGRENPQALVAAFKIAVHVVNQTKLDNINVQVRERVTLLDASLTSIESNYYRSLFANQDGREKWRQWIVKQPTVLGLCEKWGIASNSLGAVPLDLMNCAIGKMTVGLFLSFRHRQHTIDLSAIFPLDKQRIIKLGKRTHELMLTIAELTAKSMCPAEQLSDLRNLIKSDRLQSSPLYSLIEKRCLGFLVVSTFLAVATKPRYTGEIARRPFSFYGDIVSNPLNSILREAATLMGLHWRAAGVYFQPSTLLDG